jgi:hypothetical protein
MHLLVFYKDIHQNARSNHQNSLEYTNVEGQAITNKKLASQIKWIILTLNFPALIYILLINAYIHLFIFTIAN